MDWGLVLASQGIEATIQGPEGEESWGLVVAAEDYDKAAGAISQYRLENQGWPWQRPAWQPAYRFDWGSLGWVLLILFFFWRQGRAGLRPAGVMDSTLVSHGEWWRLFTAVWLHADVGHLAANATLGFLLVGLVMGRYGSGVGLLAAYMTGVAGNAGAWLLAPGPYQSLGASGMVFGSLGLLAGQSLPLRAREALPPRLMVSGLLAGVMLLVLFGLGPQTDVLAHVGGFVSGLLLGAGLALVPRLPQRAGSNLLCGLIFGALIMLPWWLASKGPVPQS